MSSNVVSYMRSIVAVICSNVGVLCSNVGNVGSFELFVNYCFGITPKPKISIHKNPIWL